MSSSISSLIPLLSSMATGTSQAVQAGSQQSNSVTGNVFGEAFSLNISDAALNGLGNSGDGSSSTTDVLSAFSYSSNSGSAQSGTSSFEELLASFTSSSPTQNTSSSTTPDGNGIDQLLNFIEQILTSLENPGSNPSTSQASATAADPATADSTSFAVATLQDGGPLPAFLAQVDAQMGLNSTQQQALQNIANENMNVNNTPDTVQKIAGELAQAGI